jgi:CxxC motif-containing protein
MVEERHYHCQGCSKSCNIKVELLNGRIQKVAGHGCQQGKDMVVDFIMMD